MIRKACQADNEAIFELEKELFLDFYSLQTITNDIKNKNNIYYVFEDGGKVLGYCLLSYIFEEGNVAKIGVSKDFQHQGIATALYKECEKEAKKKGVTKIYLEVSEKNDVAINLYKKLGFTEEWVRSKYYSDLSDAIIFEKQI